MGDIVRVAYEIFHVSHTPPAFIFYFFIFYFLKKSNISSFMHECIYTNKHTYMHACMHAYRGIQRHRHTEAEATQAKELGAISKEKETYNRSKRDL